MSDFDPSAALARLAFALHCWERETCLDPKWLATVERVIAGEKVSSTAPADRSLSELAQLAAPGLAAAEADRPTVEQFQAVIRAVHILDQWHEPLLEAMRGAARSEAHAAAYARLRPEAESRANGGGYNAAGRHGRMIPARLAATHLEADKKGEAKRSLLVELLHFTTYLPQTITAGHPSNPESPERRQIGLRYLLPGQELADGRDPLPAQPVIAVAPVLQSLDHAQVHALPDQPAYTVRPIYPEDRLRGIVEQALEAGSHILFLPEMSVNEEHLDRLGHILRTCSGAHSRRHGLPELRYVVAGIWGPPTEARPRHRNYIQVLNILGERLAEQDKLSRWDLSEDQQKRYDIQPGCGAPAWLEEHIHPGENIWIMDLWPFGRFLTLICADMSHDQPGDWLVQNVAIDWLHAPIMDKSIDCVRTPEGRLEPWIVDRAERALEHGVDRIIVTNSTLLTLRLNEANIRRADPRYPPVGECVVGFFIDGSGPRRRYRKASIPVDVDEPMVDAVPWLHRFAPFPPV
ncbi:MAG TPA: hypothetical protein VFP12_05805 [Allosphingosinicella sp.]|nr:hypothetical protein [Allosphingosinicella sp.]